MYEYFKMDDDIFERQLNTRYMILCILIRTLEKSLRDVEDDLEFYSKYNYSKELSQSESRRKKLIQDISHYHSKLHEMFPV
jgi:hypothetical protein